MNTNYSITVWAYQDGVVEEKLECTCETHSQAISIFDIITRGIRGHYEAWLIDEKVMRGLRYSSVLQDAIGE